MCVSEWKFGNSESDAFDEVRVIDYSANFKFALLCSDETIVEPNVESFPTTGDFSGGPSSWEGGLWDCVRGHPCQGRSEGGHQARRQGQDQGVGQGKSLGEEGE